jgi:hypothetical protein
VAADFRNNGQLDVLVRQISGGAITLYENHLPRQHYLEVSLRGSKSNKLGLGARLTLTAGRLTQTRELYPADSFHSQAPSLVHFGLGASDRVDRLTIRWPSGAEQAFTDFAADRHIVVDEGTVGPEAIETILPGRTIRP